MVKACILAFPRKIWKSEAQAQERGEVRGER